MKIHHDEQQEVRLRDILECGQSKSKKKFLAGLAPRIRKQVLLMLLQLKKTQIRTSIRSREPGNRTVSVPATSFKQVA